MSLESIASQIIFPFYASVGLILFGMILFSIRRIILEWITFRVSYRTYAIINNWAEIHDLGWDEIDAGKLWKSLDQNRGPADCSRINSAIRKDAEEIWSVNIESGPLLPPGHPNNREPCNPRTRSSRATLADLRNQINAQGSCLPVPNHSPSLSEGQEFGYVPFRKFQTVTSSIRPSTADQLARNRTMLSPEVRHENSLRLYTLLQESLVSQLLLASTLNIIYVMLFAGFLAYAEKWNLLLSLNVCFGAITTMGNDLT